MSQKIVEKSTKLKLNPPKIKNIRQDCSCLLGNDIGAYNSCKHFCKYCYANANVGLVKENIKKHIETSPFLIGKEEVGDKVHVARQKSWKVEENEQISFI